MRLSLRCRGTTRVLPHFLLLVGISALTAEASGASVPRGWFPWPAVEPAPGSALDVSHLNPKPAGESGRILVKDARFVTAGGERIRFWGVNLSAEVAFPPLDEIPMLARRLAKGGVNIARLHHLDNQWAVQNGGSLWPRDRADHESVDPGQLDRLHRLVAALKAEGVYSNLNLKVSRSLGTEDGFPETITQLPLFQKRVDIFHPRMVELQKKYARQLLTTRNPYTGLSMAEDPAVAVIEINNENSLLGFWTRDLGRGLDRLPEPFRGELTSQWNAWLARRYADDTAIADAWGPGRNGTESVSLLPPAATWIRKATGTVGFELVAGPGPDALELRVAQPSGVPWHAQAVLTGFTLIDGEAYTIRFTARADVERPFGVAVGLDNQARPAESWRGFGLLDTVTISPEWTPVRLMFSAHSSSGAPAALQLNAGQVAGRIEIKNLSLTLGAEGAGLQPGQSAREDSIPIPSVAGKQQWADWLHFLADTERAYADEMRRYLKDELGVTAPIACSQIEYGGLIGLWREQEMDFTDSHAYWQHPDLEDGDFDSPNWSIRNSPQLAGFGPRTFGELGDRALLRVAHKPFALSEYDHSAPSEYASEMYPTLATFACRQDWDALYPFDIGLNGSRNPDGRIGRFFDQLHHPAKWGFAPFAALVFRQELVPIATRAQELELIRPVWTPHLHADLAWNAARGGDGSIDFLNTRWAVSDQPGRGGTVRAQVHEGEDASAPITLVAAPHGQVYVIASAAAAGVVGYIGGARIEAGALRVACDRFGRDFAAVTAVALDGQPLAESPRILVTIVGRANNQGITWNKDRTSVGADWGHGPPITEHVPATISLTTSARQVFALAPDGSRAKKIAAQRRDGMLTFSVGPRERTIHYEIVGR